MPTIKAAIEKNKQMQAQQASQVTGSTPLPTPAHLVVAAPPQDVPLGAGLPQRGMFPANMVLSGDRNDSSRMFRGPGTRSATFPFPVVPTTNTKIVSTTIASSAAAAAAVEFLTNNSPNPVQNVLNLLQGAGINISVDQYGNVTITNTQQFTANAIELIDNFVFSADPSVNSAQIGELKWYMSGNSSVASGDSLTQTGAFPYLGTFNWPNDTSAASFQAIVTPSLAEGSGATDALWPLFDYPNWSITYKFRLTRYTEALTSTPFPLAQTSVYVGLMAPSTGSNVTIRRPAAGAWLRFDTDPTSPAISDSTFWFECVSNDITSGTFTTVQGNTFNTTIVPAEFVWYTLVLTYTAAGTVNFALTGTDGSAASASLAMPTFTVDSAGGGTSFVHAGLADIEYGGILSPFGIGSKVTFSGTITLDGTETLQFAGLSKTHNYFSTTGAATAGPLSISGVGFPAVVPFYLMGNDTQATPAQNKQIAVDFFEFIWNPA